jgi:hypothetical protein
LTSFHSPPTQAADLDAIPEGDTGEPQSGYLVGFDTPTAQDAALLHKLAEEFGDAPATTNPDDIVCQHHRSGGTGNCTVPYRPKPVSTADVPWDAVRWCTRPDGMLQLVPSSRFTEQPN